MADILKLNQIELNQKALGFKKKLAELRFDKVTGKLIDTSKPQKIKRQLAQVLTRISELKRQPKGKS